MLFAGATTRTNSWETAPPPTARLPSLQNLVDVIAITAGDDHSCALRVNGSVYCWGDNGVGALGIGNTVNQPTPVQVPNVTGAISISAGSGHTCAVLVAGTVRCWGWNIAGQIGDGTSQTRLSPVAISGVSGVVAISAGSLHTCALQANGTGFALLLQRGRGCRARQP